MIGILCVMTGCINTDSEAGTVSLGSRIGALLKGGEIIELVSDVGGGKTTLTRGIVAGLGASNTAVSPTFTISKVYQIDELEVHHYDFYRLGEIGLMSDELQEVLTDDKAIVVIEWAGTAHNVLPKERLIQVKIQQDGENEKRRQFAVSLPIKYDPWAEELELEVC